MRHVLRHNGTQEGGEGKSAERHGNLFGWDPWLTPFVDCTQVARQS